MVSVDVKHHVYLLYRIFHTILQEVNVNDSIHTYAIYPPQKFSWFSKTATGVQLQLQHSTIHNQKHSHVKVSKSITQ